MIYQFKSMSRYHHVESQNLSLEGAGRKAGPPNADPGLYGPPIPGPPTTGPPKPPPTTRGGPTGLTTPGLVCIPGVIGSASIPTPMPPYPIPMGGLPPTILGAPTGVTTPGVAWMPGVMGSASTTGRIIGATIGGAMTGATTG